MSQYLWLAGALIFLFLGSLHLFYTFFSGKFKPWDIDTENKMKNTNPVISRQTTMWKAWVGFNASHSLGAIYFGIINILLSIGYTPSRGGLWVLILATLTSLSYLLLAKKYWFSVPFKGVLIATLCFLVALMATIFGWN